MALVKKGHAAGRRLVRLILPAALVALLPAAALQAQPAMDTQETADNIAKLSDGVSSERPEETFNRLRVLARGNRLQSVPAGLFNAAVNLVRRQGDEMALLQFAYEFAQSERFAGLDHFHKGVIAFPAFDQCAKLGDRNGAAKLLPYINYPSELQGKLADRQYEPLWPILEEFVGDHFDKAYAQDVERTARELGQKPDNLTAMSSYLRSLHIAGRDDEVVAIVDGWWHQRDKDADLTEAEGWLLNRQADALIQLHREDEALAVYDRFLDISSRRNPWVLNFLINRADTLVSLGRWEEGLAASELALKAMRSGTDWAKLVIAADRVCALHRLGRGVEAARDLEDLRKFYDKSGESGVMQATTALLCAGLDAEAEQRLSAALADRRIIKVPGKLLDDRQYDLDYPPDRFFRGTGELILSNPALSAPVLAHVRILPAKLAPRALLQWIELERAQAGKLAQSASVR